MDDASDGSEAILEDWVQNDQRIRIIKGPGKGVVKNFENAFKHCRGEIIFLSDQEIGSFHGRTALIHTEKINGKKYNTYLYQEKGALRELMVREGLDTTTMQGEKIVAAKDFSVIETKQLYHIKIQGSDGKIYQNCVYRHSRN